MASSSSQTDQIGTSSQTRDTGKSIELVTTMASPSSQTHQTGTSPQTHETAEENNLNQCLDFYKALLKGELTTVKSICNRDPNAIEVRITEKADTALHVAVGTGKANRVVNYLVNKMSPLQLQRQNNDGDTALSIAAKVGNLDAAKKLVEINPELNKIPNNNGWVPLLEAAQQGLKEMVEYLWQHRGDYFKDPVYDANKPIVLFMHFLIIAGLYDMALQAVGSHPGLGKVEFYNGESLLTAIAGKPCHFRPRLRERSMPSQHLKLVKFLCAESTSLDFTRTSSILKRPLLLGAQLGNEELVQEIINSFPHALWFSDAENHNVLQLAVMNRQENVFNLIYDMGNYKHLLLGSQDTSGNNILHLAGKLAPQHRLNRVSGAALQMQRELQWFMEVKKIVQPSFNEDRNSEEKTPAMVFTEAHKNLVIEGEKWMKDTASSSTLVAALIATVAFAAAITFPGGNRSNDGHPMFAKTKVFIIYVISDAISLFSSIAAIIIFLSILTARYAQGDFLFALPKRLIFGLVSLFLSIISMMVAFSATLYLVVWDAKLWIRLLAGISASFPVYLFLSLQFALLVDVIDSTYGPSNFYKKSKKKRSFLDRVMLHARELNDIQEIL